MTTSVLGEMGGYRVHSGPITITHQATSPAPPAVNSLFEQPINYPTPFLTDPALSLALLFPLSTTKTTRATTIKTETIAVVCAIPQPQSVATGLGNRIDTYRPHLYSYDRELALSPHVIPIYQHQHQRPDTSENAQLILCRPSLTTYSCLSPYSIRCSKYEVGRKGV